MKSAFLGLFGSFFCTSLLAVSMNFGGSVGTQASYYSNLGLGVTGSEPIKNYLYTRALLTPNLLIDDHFSIRSQWNLLTSPRFTPDATQALGQGQGGYILGDVQSAALVLGRAWLEWTSDFGVFRVGRMPFSWGYGLMWDSGDKVWDYWQTTLDRIEYRLHLGHVVGALAYSKGRKMSVLGNLNDQEFYTAYLQYDNPELDVEGGILYEKQSRSRGQESDWLGSPRPTVWGNPYALPASTPASQTYPLSSKFPYPSYNNVVDAYLRKTVGYFSFGGEIGWLAGDAFDYGGDGRADSLNSIGVMFSTSFEYHKFKAFMEFVFAQGDGDLKSGHLNGFVLMNRNRSPGLILGHELLGSYYGNNAAMGSMVVYGDADTFSGVMYLRPGIKFEWSSSWSSGLEVIWAKKAATAPGEASGLGVEIDVGTEYAVYKNFDLGANIGYLIPGDGLRVPNANGVFGFRTTGALRF